MKNQFRRIAVVLSVLVALIFIFTGCGGNTEKESQGTEIVLGELFMPSNQDPHEGYNSWNMMIYGMVETLFKVDDDMNVQPWLAEDAESDGNTWTITLKDGLNFCNGEKTDSKAVIASLKRTAEINERFAFMSDFNFEEIDEKRFTITSDEPYPTMKNLLTSCETAIIDVKSDPNEKLITTGPFIIESFQPENQIDLVKNEKYWNGDVTLERAKIYKIENEDSLLLAMQNGEIDAYINVNGAAKETFEKEPDKYNLVETPTSRVQMFMINRDNVDEKIREAICSTIDPTKMMAQLGQIMTPTEGPFNSSLSYGKQSKIPLNLEHAKELIEGEGYKLNEDNIYEKNGEELTLTICYYSGRSLDKIATIMQSQLSDIGIKAVLECYESAEEYFNSPNTDISLYSMNADIYGDPQHLINNIIKEGAPANATGYNDSKCNDLINELEYELEPEKRAELANEIVQMAIDDYSYGFMTHMNKITVLTPGITNFNEKNPFDFYGIQADTTR